MIWRSKIWLLSFIWAGPSLRCHGQTWPLFFRMVSEWYPPSDKAKCHEDTINIWLVFFYLFSIIYIWDVILPIDELIFFKMVKASNQINIHWYGQVVSLYHPTYVKIYIPLIRHEHIQLRLLRRQAYQKGCLPAQKDYLDPPSPSKLLIVPYMRSTFAIFLTGT